MPNVIGRQPGVCVSNLSKPRSGDSRAVSKISCRRFAALILDALAPWLTPFAAEREVNGSQFLSAFVLSCRDRSLSQTDALPLKEIRRPILLNSKRPLDVFLKQITCLLELLARGLQLFEILPVRAVTLFD